MIDVSSDKGASLIQRIGAAAGMLAMLQSACAQPQRVRPIEKGAPAADALYRADPVIPGRLAYAPDRESFAPVLTEPFAYPTQRQAVHAWQRANVSRGDLADQDKRLPVIWLFGCKPGTLDSLTGRITRYRGPVVHCAVGSGFAPGHQPPRETVNFYYYSGAWHLLSTDPPRMPVAWRHREKSERDPWRFLPWRDRYE